jgi:hypothetical protein
MKTFHLCWIPHELTNKLREIWIKEYRELLPVLEGLEKGNFRNPVTGDENWFSLQFRHSAKLAVSRGGVLQKSSS